MERRWMPQYKASLFSLTRICTPRLPRTEADCCAALRSSRALQALRASSQERAASEGRLGVCTDVHRRTKGGAGS